MIRFIATRLNASRNAGNVSRPAIVIATAGVAVGLVVMILTICVTMGFKSQIHDIVRHTGGDIHIFNSGSISGNTSPTLVVSDDVMDSIRAIPGIERAHKVSSAFGCLKTDSAFIGIQLVGREGIDTLADNSIVISTTQAAQLGLRKGDQVMAYFFKESIRARRFTVADTYVTNLSDFDATQVFTSFNTIRQIAGYKEGECDRVQLYAAKDDMAQTQQDELPYDLFVLQHIRRLIPLTPECQPTVATLEELHSQVFTWLDLLDLNVWVILVIMLCVSGFTMASGLFILILERTQMIGLMQALGARFSTLRHIFLYIAGIILLRGMVIGNIVAYALAWAQAQWHIIRLNPADYYVDAVPIVIPWGQIALLNVCTMALTIAVLVIPTYIIGRISPVKAMRFD